MTISFAPLDPDAVAFLTEETDIDFLRTDFTQPRWFCVTARRWDGSLQGVAAFEFKTWFEAHFTTAIADPHCMSRKLLTTIFGTLFRQAVRITALIDPGNQQAIDRTRRMGFVYEGFLRMGVEGRRDALIFGMLAEDCRYLPGYDPVHRTVPSLALGGAHHGLNA